MSRFAKFTLAAFILAAATTAVFFTNPELFQGQLEIFPEEEVCDDLVPRAETLIKRHNDSPLQVEDLPEISALIHDPKNCSGPLFNQLSNIYRKLYTKVDMLNLVQANDPQQISLTQSEYYASERIDISLLDSKGQLVPLPNSWSIDVIYQIGGQAVIAASSIPDNANALIKMNREGTYQFTAPKTRTEYSVLLFNERGNIVANPYQFTVTK